MNKSALHKDFFYRFGFWIFLVLLFLIGYLLFRDFLLFERLFLFTDIGSDTLNAAFPRMVHDNHYWVNEGWPITWSHSVGLGKNLYQGFRVELTDPLKTIFNEGLLGPQFLAKRIAYFEFLKLIGIGLITYAYTRIAGFDRFTCILGGLSMAFCCYAIIGSTWYVHSTIILNTMMLVLATELYLRKGLLWLLPICIFIFGLRAELIFYLGFISLYIFLRTTIDTDVKGSRTKNWLGFMALISIGLLLLGNSWDYFFQNFFGSQRISEGASVQVGRSASGFFGSEKLYITILLRFLGIDILGNGSFFRGWGNYLEAPAFYCGLIHLLILPQLLWLSKGRTKVVLLSYVIFLICVLLFPPLRKALYLFTGDYFKTALSFVIPFSLVFGSLLGLSKFTLRGKVNVPLLLVCFVVLLFFLLYPYAAIRSVNKTTCVVMAYFLCGHVMVILLMKYNEKLRWLKFAMLFLLASELYFNAQQSFVARKTLEPAALTDRSGYNDHAIGAIRYLNKTDDGFYRLEKNYFTTLSDHFSLNDAMVQDYYGMSVYAAFNQSEYVKFLDLFGLVDTKKVNSLKWIMRPRKEPLVQGLVGVKYLLNRNKLALPNDGEHLKFLRKFEDVDLFAHQYYLPLGTCYEQFIGESDFRSLPISRRKEFAYEYLVVKDDNSLLSEGALDFSGFDFESAKNRRLNDTLAITNHSHKTISGLIDLDKPKELFLAIPYDQGWKAQVNGSEKPIYSSFSGLMAISLDKGMNEVELSYHNYFSIIARLVLALGLLGIFLLIFRTRIAEKIKPARVRKIVGARNIS